MCTTSTGTGAAVLLYYTSNSSIKIKNVLVLSKHPWTTPHTCLLHLITHLIVCISLSSSEHGGQQLNFKRCFEATKLEKQRNPKALQSSKWVLSFSISIERGNFIVRPLLVTFYALMDVDCCSLSFLSFLCLCVPLNSLPLHRPIIYSSSLNSSLRLTWVLV